MSNLDDLDRRMTEVEGDVKEILAWVNQQKGGRSAFYAAIAAAAGFGAAVMKVVDLILLK